MNSRCTTRWLLAGLFALVTKTALAAEVNFPSGKFEPSDPETVVSGQLFRPDGPGPYPAIVLLHTCGGLKQHVTHDWPQFLTELGYVVLATDTLGSRGYYRGCSAFRERYAAQARDAYGALDYLARQSFVDAGRIAAMGFSMGAITINGFILTRAARPAGNPEYKAFASFYGHCRAMQKKGVLRDAPLLQIVAEKDVRLAPSCIETSKSVKMEAHVLPGVHHAFDQPDITQMRSDSAGNMMLYDSDATEKARSLVRAFLTRHMK